MTEKEMMQRTIEEFSRIQRYMLLAEKDSDVYKALKERYIDLKVGFPRNPFLPETILRDN